MIPLIEQTVPRDRWGRPVLDGVTYTRVSTLAKVLDDQSALIRWSSRQTALGMATSEDLIAAVATTNPDDRRALDGLVEQAKERASSHRGATIGTAVHAATETADRGGDISRLPEKIRADVAAYRELIERAGLEPLAAEMFVACPELHVAGTFDRLMVGPNRVIVADLKTSGSADTAKYAALSWAIQIAVYARSTPWIEGRGLVDWADLGLPAPDRTRGLVIHVQQGTGIARLHTVDLNVGWTAARIACEVKDLRALKDVAAPIPLPSS